MSQKIIEMTRQEQLDRRRYYSVLWFLVGFVVWLGSRTAQEIWPLLRTSSLDVFATGIALAGWGVWGYYLIRIVLLCRGLSEQERKRMNDERIQQNRRSSFVVGFWTMLGATGAVLLVSSHLTTSAAAHLLLLAGVVASTGAFLYFESDGAQLKPNDAPPEVAHE